MCLFMTAVVWLLCLSHHVCLCLLANSDQYLPIVMFSKHGLSVRTCIFARMGVVSSDALEALAVLCVCVCVCVCKHNHMSMNSFMFLCVCFIAVVSFI